MDTLTARLRRAASPPWVGPVMLGVATLNGALALLIERGPYDHGAALGPLTAQSTAMGALYILAWGGELLGLLRPRLLFVPLALAPVSVLLYGGRDTMAPLLGMLVAGWVAYTRPRRDAALGLALALLCLIPPFVVGRGPFDNWLTWSLGTLISWLLGLLLAVQQRTLAALRAAQADLARQIAAEERRHLARELHDVTAHTLAVTMLHLTGARHVLQRDPARAAEALAQAEELGRQSLADLRRAVSLLADGPPGGRVAPALGAPDIPGLVAELAGAGMPLHSTIQGQLEAIPAGLGLDLYRMAQEALANAAKHAPGQAVRLELTVDGAAVSLLVRNALAAGAGQAELRGAGQDGRGLAGLRARAARHGGQLDLGRDGEGWHVAARFPLTPQPDVEGASATQEAI